MYAIVDIAGKQYKVEKDKKIFINRIKGEVGSKVDLNKVLFIDNDGEVKIGYPFLKEASVTGKILSHLKDKKVKIFKKKKRKGYSVLNSHRQFLTEVLIEDISDKRVPKETIAEKDTVKKIPEKKVTPETKTSEKKTDKKITSAKTTKKTTTGKKATKKQAGTKTTAAKKAPAGKKDNLVKKPAAKKTVAKKATPGKKKLTKKSN